MTECFVYDTVRTPRGKGKKDGALHEVTALELGTQVLKAVRDRNNLDTAKVDDVVFGCVDPVGEGAGRKKVRIAKRSAMMASRYAHAKQFKRHHRQLRLLRSRSTWWKIPRGYVGS